VKRPRQRQIRFPNKPKALDIESAAARLEQAAVKAKYSPSPYHCRDPKGRRPKRRAKPTMHCPRDWTDSQAIVALREAIRARQVSMLWNGGFPRYVWHLEGTVIYEARLSGGALGTYHAYPIEAAAAPAGLEW
jgi:hypothetical protein